MWDPVAAGPRLLTVALIDDEAVAEFDDEPGTETPRQHLAGRFMVRAGHDRHCRVGRLLAELQSRDPGLWSCKV